ncbi:hypothetical protein, partial [Cronobacter sakazakii]
IIRLKNIDGKIEVVFYKYNYEKIMKAIHSSNELTDLEKDAFLSLTGLDFSDPSIKERPSHLNTQERIINNEKKEIIKDRNRSL